MKRALVLVLVLLSLCFATNAGAAIQTFFGEDLNGSNTPLATFPNASAAEASFLANLIGVGTETFEGFANGTSQPLMLSFPGAGTAVLSGNGTVESLADGVSITGRYGVTMDADPDERLFAVSAATSGTFTVTFGAPIAAFGFFGTDIGDFGGMLSLQLAGGSMVMLNVPNSTTSSANGAVLFYGFIGTTPADLVTSVAFSTSATGGDVFGFDDFTVGSLQQVVAPGTVPEPAALLVWALLIGIGIAARVSRH